MPHRFIISICRQQFENYWMGFYELLYWGILIKCVDTILFWLQSDNSYKYLHAFLHVYSITYWIFTRWKDVSNKRKMKHVLCPVHFFCKSCIFKTNKRELTCQNCYAMHEGKDKVTVAVKHHIMKSGSVAPHILNLGARQRWEVSFMPWLLFLQQKSLQFPLDRKLSGP